MKNRMFFRVRLRHEFATGIFFLFLLTLIFQTKVMALAPETFSAFESERVSVPSGTSRKKVKARTKISGPAKTLIALEMNQGLSRLGNASGPQTEAMILFSERFQNVVLEGGGGIFYNSVSESATGASGPVNTLSLQSYEITTQAQVIKFSPQLIILPGLQIGPVAEFLFGADLSFNQGFFSGEKITAWIGGAQTLYRFSGNPFQVGLGLRYLRSLDLEDEVLSSVQATLQIAFQVR